MFFSCLLASGTIYVQSFFLYSVTPRQVQAIVCMGHWKEGGE